MKPVRFLPLLFLLFICVNKAYSSTRYWIGGTGNWTTTSHWSASSGGATDNTLPVSGDQVYIDVNSGTGTITVNSAVTISYLDFTATCSAINLNITSNTFTVTNDLTLATSSVNETVTISGGTLTTGGNANINGGIFQANSGTVNINGNYFYIAGGTANIAGATLNVGNSTNEYLRLYTGFLNISSGTVNVVNYLYIDNNNFSISGGILNLGTGMAENYIPLYVAGSGNFSGGVIDIKSVQSNGYATYITNASTFTGGTIKISATNASYYIYSQKSFNFEINSSGVNATFAGDGTFSGDFTLTNGTVDISSNNITVTGQTYFNGGTFQASFGTLTCNGTGNAISINGSTVNFAGATINVGNSTDEAIRVFSGALNISSGTVNVKNYVLIDNNGFSISGGTLNIGTGGSVTYEAFYTFGNGSFSGGVINVQSVQTGGSGIALDISSGSTFTGGLLKVSATNANYVLWTRKAYNLEISSSGKTASLPTSMTIYGNLSVTAGSLVASGGTTTFNGSVAQSVLGTSATAITLYNATLNNSNGLTIAPSSGISTTVLYTLTLTSGKITLGNYTLNIGSAGISGVINSANSSNYIITNGTGVLRQYNIGTGQRTSALFPIGVSSTSYTPITLNLSGASTVDDFSIRVEQAVYINGSNGATVTAHAVNRTWYISEGTATGSSVTLTPQWNTSDELTSFLRTSAFVKHYYSGAWNYVASGSTTGSNPYSITTSAVTSFSPFAVFDPTPLPLTLLDFNAIPGERKVDLTWTTASESNVDFYTIKKTTDGIHFQSIGTSPSQGNSTTEHVYSLIDSDPFLGISYYQLESHDFDGKISYSDLKAVNFENTSSSISVFPNPSNGNEFKFFLPHDVKDTEGSFSVYDNTGKLIHRELFNSKINCIQVSFENRLAAGMYMLIVDIDNTTQSTKLIIQ